MPRPLMPIKEVVLLHLLSLVVYLADLGKKDTPGCRLCLLGTTAVLLPARGAVHLDDDDVVDDFVVLMTVTAIF